ncbi:tripartite tricarboxylate transporter TctB family protein [Azospirillum sp. SYSU D00513]|uniref:tripartite tricarboxylate transporter TctB family protein n=1 Tax=Azospirillum sp. SYSU D00513 TaxID=2812561 RepID=UPI001A97132B|nr:tripartite tricarboxylate transporter TctB family protein [Azospirillum sp. SYSU D00513]
MRPRTPFRNGIDAQELLFGLFLVALSGVAFWQTSRLAAGTAADMGPGFVPRVIAWTILGFGAFFVLRAGILPRRALPAISLRPLVAVLGAVATFALVLPALGLVAASLAAILIGGAAAPGGRLLGTLLFAAVLTALTVLLFVTALSLPVAIWPW